ncbi:MAG TPA: hypothetical protein VGG74_13625 [Kofleriaceae bacterium]|jgi:hypothetical protein
MRTLIAALLLVSLPAIADPTPTATQMHSDDCAKARAANRQCVIDMNGIDVDGSRPGGNGIVSTVIGFTKQSSLVHIRRDFIEQILKTAQDL